MKRIFVVLAILTLAALPVIAGEWHTGQNNLCADCHTMHNSMAHTWNGAGSVSVDIPVADGNWVSSTAGGNNFLLKANEPNALCLTCHDGKDFAPDVLGTDFNSSENRSAGYLNSGAMPSHTGHTLGSPSDAPGDVTGYTPGAHGLECINCHTQHGRPGAYRNLGPRSAFTPVYAIKGQDIHGYAGSAVADKAAAVSKTIDLGGSGAGGNKLFGVQEVDVYIDVPSTYTPNSGAFKDFYETKNINYLKRSTLVNGVDNAAGAQCAACHSNFHGAVDGANIGGEATATAGAYDQFNRHPVGGVVIGKVGGGHSDPIATRYGNPASLSRVKTYTNEADFSDAAPGCVSCHKAHGNGQPFGLIFALRTEDTMMEDGTASFPANATPTGVQTAAAQRALCGQCHKQGN